MSSKELENFDKNIMETTNVSLKDAQMKTPTMAIEENFNQTMSKERLHASKPWKPKGRK